jgi:hypothetical protein
MGITRVKRYNKGVIIVLRGKINSFEGMMEEKSDKGKERCQEMIVIHLYYGIKVVRAHSNAK